jgi:DNA-binding NarL/FixJ family response regulator
VAAAIHGQASDEARDTLLEAAALAGEADQPRTGAALWGNLAIAYIHRREFTAAADASERAIALARRMQSPLLPWALGARAMALAESHSNGGALEALAEMIDETVARDMAVQTVDTLLASMSVALAAGQPLTAARAWGAASALERSGTADIPPDDRHLAERTLARVRRRAREIDVELAIRDGETLDPLAFLAGLPETLADRATESAAAGSRLRHGDLTRREIEILRLLAVGRSDGEIAAELFISPKTASVHVSNVKAKLGVESRLEAALKAREMGFGES